MVAIALKGGGYDVLEACDGKDALAKMTILPAKRLEGHVPMMKNKGRIKVGADADITIITRRDGGDAVVMSMAHYQSMAETLYLLSSPANAAHLAASIAEHKAGKAKRRELITP